MHNGFLRCYETCSHLNSFRSQHESRCHTSSVCNTARCNDRNLHCIHYLRHQCKSGDGTNMSTTFHSLCNHCICSCTFHQPCHGYACHYRNYLNSCFFPCRHILGRIAGACSNYLDTFLNNDLRHIIGIWIQQHDIYTKWLICQFLTLTYFFPYYLCRCRSSSNQSQTSGIGHCRCQIMLCDPCHSTLDDRCLCSQNLCQSRSHICLLCFYAFCFHILNYRTYCCDLLQIF